MLAPGTSAVLGQHTLAAPAADAAHIRVGRNAEGQWWLSNISGRKGVDWRSAQVKGRLRQVPLTAEQTLWVAGRHWRLTQADGAVDIRPAEAGPQAQGAQHWRYDGARLLRVLSNGQTEALAPCADARLGARLRQRWNAWAPGLLAWPAALQWGGSHACGIRLPQAELAPGSLTLSLGPDGYELAAAADAARRVCLQPLQALACAPGATLFEQALPLAGVQQITLGRTTFALEIAGDSLQFKPVRRSGWLMPDAAAPAAAVQGQPLAVDTGMDTSQDTSKRTSKDTDTDMDKLPASPAAQPALHWQTMPDDPWRWQLPGGWAVAAAAAAALTLLLAGALNVLRHVPAGAALGMALAATATVASIGLFSAGAAVGPGISLAWGLLALVGVAALPGAVGWAWCAHALMGLMLLLGLGLQWQLGLQGVDTGGWQFMHKTATLGAAGLWGLQSLAWWLRARALDPLPRSLPGVAGWELMLASTGLIALALLGLQALLGSEEGVFGIQPVELAKLALVLVGAQALAVRMEWVGPGLWRRLGLWLRLLAPLVLLGALGALSLLLLQDYSPLVLLACWLVGTWCAWSVAARSWVAAVLVGAALGLAAAGWHWMQSGEGLAWIQAHGFYGDRFAVWLHLPEHPYSGEQVLRALKLATQGGWQGDSLAPAWRVPAVQDDMAPAFFAARFGLWAVLLLWGLQCLYVATLLMLGWQALQAVQPGDHLQRWALRLSFFAAWGAAALFSGHLLLAWGTNTGGLPVMGQPMPLLSAGGSVIALLLAPLHLLWQVQAVLAGSPRQKVW